MYMNEQQTSYDATPACHDTTSVNNSEQSDADDVLQSLRMMCDCINCGTIRNDASINSLLTSWYVPRNADDVQYLLMRYAVLCRLPYYVEKLLNHRIEEI